jgi:predicted permease
MQQTWDDLRYGVRRLARTPGFTAAALITLALGIGANATLISLVDALYLRPLPVPESTRVVHGYQTRRDAADVFPLSLPDYHYYRDHMRAFEDLAAHYPSSPLHLVIDGEPVAAIGGVVTASYFPVLRLTPHAGRFFRPDEDAAPDRDAVAVVSHAFWQNRLGGDPQVVGRIVHVNGRAFTIVGVAPRGFEGALRGGGVSDLWIPSAMFHVGYRYCDAFARGCTVVQLLGRLMPGATLDAAQAEIGVLARQLESAHPATNAGLSVRLYPARGVYPAQQRDSARTVTLLLGSSGLLLFIACANVAALLLARGIARRREIALRQALGSSRARLVRELLTESAVLAIAGGALGILAAAWMKEIVGSFYATDYAGRPLLFGLELSVPVLAATAALCGVTAVLCGLAPAMRTTRADLLPSLKGDSAGSGHGRSRTRDLLVVMQFGLATMLLVGAGLLVRSVIDLSRGPGVDTDRIILLRLRPSLVGYDGARARAFQTEVIRRLMRIPGVDSASAAEGLPLFDFGVRVAVASDGTAQGPQLTGSATASHVGDRYFDTLGVPILAGRDFDSSDLPGTPRVAIVNDVLAASLGGPAQAVGRIIRIDDTPLTIVGVARSARFRTALEPAEPYIYLNYWQQDGRGFAADSRTHVRVAGDAAAMMPRIRREIAAIDPTVPLSEDYPLRERVRFAFLPVRMTASLLVGFGVAALFLSAIGLYGVVAFVTGMRTREIAIRLAVGAEGSHICALVLGQGARLAALGTGIGVAAAFSISHLLAGLLYGVQPSDPGTFIGIPSLLFGVALLASWIPARRAMRVQPALTLRKDA